MQHTYFLGLFDYEWSAVGSIATAAAAAIALLLPMALDLRRRNIERKKERANMSDVAQAADLAILYLSKGVYAWYRGDEPSFHEELAWSLGVAERLSIYAKGKTLSDDVMDICLSALIALRLFGDVGGEGLQAAYTSNRIRSLHKAFTIAIHANSCLDRLQENGVNSRFRSKTKKYLEQGRECLNQIPLDGTGWSRPLITRVT